MNSVVLIVVAVLTTLEGNALPKEKANWPKECPMIKCKYPENCNHVVGTTFLLNGLICKDCPVCAD